jgi:hypothetical protein
MPLPPDQTSISATPSFGARDSTRQLPRHLVVLEYRIRIYYINGPKLVNSEDILKGGAVLPV